MADPEPAISSATNELAAIPFGSLIGGPLTAAIEAQNLAARTTLEFIKAVGFENGENGEVRNIKFSFMNGLKETVKVKENGNEKVEERPQLWVLQVPLLSIVPIPFLRIENMDIHFKASLSQTMQTNKVDTTSVSGTVNTSVSGGFWAAKASMNASVSSKKDSSTTRDSRYSVEYTMDINVHAVQDDMPAGLAKVLGMMSEAMEHQMQSEKNKTETGTVPISPSPN